MKKITVITLVAIFIMTCCIYLFIPASVQVSAAGFIRCNSRMAANHLLSDSNWKQWWPAEKTGTYNGYTYTIKNKSPYAATLLIKTPDGKSYESVLDLVLYKTDSTGIEWKFNAETGADPVSRLMTYKELYEVKSDMKKLIAKFNSFASDERNLYGIRVEKRKFTDTFMISKQSVQPLLPSTDIIYSTIQQLTDYAKLNGAQPINPPMLNIEPASPMGYTLKMALPISKQIPSEGDFHFRFMIQGNTLFTSVKGGPTTISKAIQQMRDYISDYHYSSPAIPFQSLVTDRSKISDTTQWVTNIYYPVM